MNGTNTASGLKKRCSLEATEGCINLWLFTILWCCYAFVSAAVAVSSVSEASWPSQMVPQTNVMLEMSQNNNVPMVTLLAQPRAGMSMMGMVCSCCCCWNEWMNVLSLFRFSIMTIIIISNLFKPWNHLLQKQRGLYLHPVSSATRTLSSSWPRWRTWPRVYVGGGNKISFSSSFNG